MNIPEYARRLIVKHDSDWHSTRDDTRWSSVFKVRDESPVVKMANGGFLDATRWMDKVPPFVSQRSVWHFHPLEFLEMLRKAEFPRTPVNGELIPLEFINFYNGDRIDETDYEEAAKKLNCEVAAIKAVAKLRRGFMVLILSFSKMTIMFPPYYLKDIIFTNIQMESMISFQIYPALIREDMVLHLSNTQNYLEHMHLIRNQH